MCEFLNFQKYLWIRCVHRRIAFLNICPYRVDTLDTYRSPFVNFKLNFSFLNLQLMLFVNEDYQIIFGQVQMCILTWKICNKKDRLPCLPIFFNCYITLHRVKTVCLMPLYSDSFLMVPLIVIVSPSLTAVSALLVNHTSTRPCTSLKLYTYITP